MVRQKRNTSIWGNTPEHVPTCSTSTPWWLDDDVDSPTPEADSAPIPEEEPIEPAPPEAPKDMGPIVPADTCPACNGSGFVDVPLSHGRGVRRDCSRCGHFLDFPVWTPQKDSPC